MDRTLKILKKENGPRASSAPALELNTIIFKHVYWYMQLISGERLQDHWSSGLKAILVTVREVDWTNPLILGKTGIVHCRLEYQYSDGISSQLINTHF